MNAYERPESKAPDDPKKQQLERLKQARQALDKMIADGERGVATTAEALKLSVFEILNFEQPTAGVNRIDPRDQESMNANIEKIAKGEMIVGG